MTCFVSLCYSYVDFVLFNNLSGYSCKDLYMDLCIHPYLVSGIVVLTFLFLNMFLLK